MITCGRETREKEADMSLEINIEKRQQGTFIVSPSGSIDSETYMELENKLQPVFEAAPKAIVFDMKKVGYISSMGIGVILTTKKTLEKAGGMVMMVNLQPQIKKVFDVVQAIPGFSIFASIEEADGYLMRLQQEEMEKRRYQ